MNCLICNSSINWDVIYTYDKPDKYEKWMGIEDVKRSWEQCSCGFYQSRRNYPIEDLQKIYTDGYRDIGFRHRPISEAFQYVTNLPKEESENERRLEYFMDDIDNSNSVLDIGSGLGVFPKRLQEEGYYVWCVEPNKESQRFINEDLKIKCVPDIRYFYIKGFPPGYARFDVVTLIHVLEHIVDPVQFLKEIKKVTGKALCIEVPDSSEFEQLKKGHNEFSSDHVYFYDRTSLDEIISRAGFEMCYVFYSYYNKRNLTRLTMTCRKQ